MSKVEIYTTNLCPFCARAKARLDRKAVAYEEIDVTNDSTRKLEMVSRSSRHTVPQIFINGLHLGGSDDLNAADSSGYLDRLLSDEEQGKAA